ncbi:FkbM family methyltransferase [Labrys neptuniae]
MARPAAEIEPSEAMFSRSSIFPGPMRPEPRNTKYVFAEIVDYVLAMIEPDAAPLTFVQVGADDGMRGDPISRHVIQGSWRGLLVEPVPAAMERLRTHYGTRDFHIVRGEDVLSSFSLPTIMMHELKYDDLPGMIETVPVTTRRLDSLCRETGFETADLLVIDVEGCDDIVLRTFDFDLHRPSAILFEHVALTAEASRAIGEFLEKLGYHIIYDRHDCLCLLGERFEPRLVEFLGRVVKAAREN